MPGPHIGFRTACAVEVILYAHVVDYKYDGFVDLGWISKWFLYASLGITVYNSPSIDGRVQHLKKDKDKKIHMLKHFFFKQLFSVKKKKRTEQKVETAHLFLTNMFLFCFSEKQLSEKMERHL